MTKKLNFLLIILGIVIIYVCIKTSIESLEHKIYNDIAEKEAIIYKSIQNNTNFINIVIDKIK